MPPKITAKSIDLVSIKEIKFATTKRKKSDRI